MVPPVPDFGGIGLPVQPRYGVPAPFGSAFLPPYPVSSYMPTVSHVPFAPNPTYASYPSYSDVYAPSVTTVPSMSPATTVSIRAKRPVFKTTLRDIVPKRELIGVAPDTSIEAVLRILRDENITSVPVYDHSGEKSLPFDVDVAKILGMVAVTDIVNFTVFGIAGDDAEQADLNNLEKLDHPIRNLIGSSPEGRAEWAIKSYDIDMTLEEVMYPFTVGVHRVVVWDKYDRRDYPLSQTDVVRYLYTSPDVDHDVINATIEARELTTARHIVSIDNEATALQAFRKMAVKDVSSIAIVDAEGKLVANMSLSDLRGLDRETFPELGLPVVEYLAKKHGGTTRGPVTVTADTTLFEVMGILLSQATHRVWVVDADGKPVSQISMTDVITQFAPKDFVWPTP